MINWKPSQRLWRKEGLKCLSMYVTEGGGTEHRGVLLEERPEGHDERLVRGGLSDGCVSGRAAQDSLDRSVISSPLSVNHGGGIKILSSSDSRSSTGRATFRIQSQ